MAEKAISIPAWLKIFKQVLIKDRQIVELELYEPFKSFFEAKEPCQKNLMEEITEAVPSGCISLPSAARWDQLTRAGIALLGKIYGFSP